MTKRGAGSRGGAGSAPVSFRANRQLIERLERIAEAMRQFGPELASTSRHEAAKIALQTEGGLDALEAKYLVEKKRKA